MWYLAYYALNGAGALLGIYILLNMMANMIGRNVNDVITQLIPWSPLLIGFVWLCGYIGYRYGAYLDHLVATDAFKRDKYGRRIKGTP